MKTILFAFFALLCASTIAQNNSFNTIDFLGKSRAEITTIMRSHARRINSMSDSANVTYTVFRDSLEFYHVSCRFTQSGTCVAILGSDRPVEATEQDILNGAILGLKNYNAHLAFNGNASNTKKLYTGTIEKNNRKYDITVSLWKGNKAKIEKLVLVSE